VKEVILKTEIPGVTVAWNGTTWLFGNPSDARWKVRTNQAKLVLYAQEEIDIAGLTTIEENTFFPVAAAIQQSGFYLGPGLIQPDPAQPKFPYGTLFEYVMVTEAPFKVDKWVADNSLSGTQSTQNIEQKVPGLLPRRTTNQESTLGFDNILYGRVQMLVNNSTLPQQAAVPYTTNEFGSMTGTVSDTLYVTRFISLATYGDSVPVGTNIAVPDHRVIIAGSTKEEPDLSYIMRMRQSYLLAQDLN